VIDSLHAKEIECQDREGRWHSLRIRPYRTKENKIDGAVLALVDVDELKQSLDYMLDSVREPALLVLYPDLRVKAASKSFCEKFHVSRKETEGNFIYDLGNKQWNIPALRTLLEQVLPKNSRVSEFKVDHEFPDIGRRTMLLDARRLFPEGRGTQSILLSIYDVTEKEGAK
jgi:two-component system CheB/CheR fusion protein